MVEVSPLTLTTVLVVVVLPAVSFAALLLAVGRRERARQAVITRQIAVTDAVHRELGAVAAPVLKRRIGRGWRIEVAVPFDAPATVGRVVAIAHATMRRRDPGEAIEIVLTAQTPQARPIEVRRRQPAGIAPLAASEREVIAWTGTPTSRAS